MATVHSTNPFAEGVERFCSGLILSDEKFEAMSRQAAVDLRENRSAYFARVILMAALGYGYIALIIGVSVGGLGFIAYSMWHGHHMNFAVLKVLLVLGFFVFWMLRALWIKNPPPVGVKVCREEAPRLFELIDRYQTELNTKVDHVLINDDFNAFVTQIPRLGLLGMHTNYLVIGLPLLAALNADQFKAVLAHELGHLSGNHGKSSAWVYGLRARWSQLLISMRQDSPFIFAVFYVFFSWLAPRFNAYTMAMARAHEIDADTDAGRIAGGGNVASSLVLVRLKGRYLSEKVWNGVLRQAIDHSTPPPGVFNQVTEALRSLPLEDEKIQDWLKQALSEKGSGMDTHPPLAVRLSERGCLESYKHLNANVLYELRRPIENGESAAEFFLGDALPIVLGRLSDDWSQAVAPFWSDKHDFFKHARERLTEMETKQETEELTLEEMKEKGYYLSEMYGIEKCRPVFEEILQRFPADPMANYTVGMMLLDDGDDEGLALLEKAMGARVSLIAECCARIEAYLEERGRAEEARKYESKLAQYHNESERAERERQGVTSLDNLLPHGLDASWLDYIGEVLPHLEKVKNAYLVQKQVNYFPEYPYLVLAIDTRGNAEEKLELARFLLANLKLPDQFCVITFDGDTKKVRENILQVEGSHIYKSKAAKK